MISNNKIKYIVSFSLFFLLIYSVIAKAANPIEVDKSSSLSIDYKYEEMILSQQEISIFRIASVDESGRYTLTSPFDSYKVNIYGITSQSEWKEVCSTLTQYIIADKINPYKTVKTNSQGVAEFENIQTGMYLTMGVTVIEESRIISFESFLSVVPYPSEDGHIYDVTAKPKYESVIPTPEKEQIKIIKQWKDTGFESKRPESVLVDIYKNGEFYSTHALTAQNNWAHSFESESGYIWTAVERQIPDEYTVTVVKNGNTIILTNVYEGDEPTPGKPGDQGLFYKYVIISFLSGVALIVLAISVRKRKA
jgi:hypothetical protein